LRSNVEISEVVKRNAGEHHIERCSVELFEADGLYVRTFGSARVDSNDLEPEGCEFPSDRAITAANLQHSPAFRGKARDPSDHFG
jgi:hypothetical protein